MKSIGAMIAEYHEEKRMYQSACNGLRDKAIELGMDSEYAKDVTKAISFLEGYRSNPSYNSVYIQLNNALDMLEGAESTKDAKFKKAMGVLAEVTNSLRRS
mgnify:CR=1 FL=1